MPSFDIVRSGSIPSGRTGVSRAGFLPAVPDTISPALKGLGASLAPIAEKLDQAKQVNAIVKSNQAISGIASAAMAEASRTKNPEHFAPLLQKAEEEISAVSINDGQAARSISQLRMSFLQRKTAQEVSDTRAEAEALEFSLLAGGPGENVPPTFATREKYKAAIDSWVKAGVFSAAEGKQKKALYSENALLLWAQKELDFNAPGAALRVQAVLTASQKRQPKKAKAQLEISDDATKAAASLSRNQLEVPVSWTSAGLVKKSRIIGQAKAMERETSAIAQAENDQQNSSVLESLNKNANDLSYRDGLSPANRAFWDNKQAVRQQMMERVGGFDPFEKTVKPEVYLAVSRAISANPTGVTDQEILDRVGEPGLTTVQADRLLKKKFALTRKDSPLSDPAYKAALSRLQFAIDNNLVTNSKLIPDADEGTKEEAANQFIHDGLKQELAEFALSEPRSQQELQDKANELAEPFIKLTLDNLFANPFVKLGDVSGKELGSTFQSNASAIPDALIINAITTHSQEMRDAWEASRGGGGFFSGPGITPERFIRNWEPSVGKKLLTKGVMEYYLRVTGNRVDEAKRLAEADKWITK